MSESILAANERAVERYRRTVVIELNADDDLHVTLKGVHTVNDVSAFRRALAAILERSPAINAALGVSDEDTTK